MRMIPRGTLVLVVLAWLVAPVAVRADEVRGALENHRLRTLDGEVASLDDLDGRTVVVNFWAEWCAPCRRELPVLDAWHTELDGRDVTFVAISIDREARRARRLAEDLGLDLPLYHDGPEGLAATLDLPALPITYVVDPDGRTVHVSTGSDAEDLDSLRDAIVATSSTTRRPVSPTEGAER
jgi:thiol-disulfide isomerase/thioredoxin